MRCKFICVLAVFFCVYALYVPCTAAQETVQESEVQDSQAQKDDETSRSSTKEIVGNIIQIVLFIIFLAAVYYVFIYPEDQGREKKSAEETDASEEKDTTDSEPEKKEEVSDEDIPAEEDQDEEKDSSEEN